MIDEQGYRPNVGIIVANDNGQVLWARRLGQDAWQFPQGGIRSDETPEEALYRELAEEIGLSPSDVEVVGNTQGWLRYQLPSRHIHYRRKPVCIGQKQIWFLLRLVTTEKHVKLDNSENPEFDHWCWVQPEAPVKEVIFFKREVYQTALDELIPLISD